MAASASPPRVSIIVAMDDAGIIGAGGRLPWRVPEDLAHFRRTTMGHAVVMGRKTFQGLPRPLDGRQLIVMSRDAGFRPPAGVTVARSPAGALELARGDEVFVAGGAEVYAAFLPLADRLYVSRVAGRHQGDTLFPPVDWGEWDLADEQQAGGVSYRRYHRMRPGATTCR
jgi:dihydrofolate reductase